MDLPVGVPPQLLDRRPDVRQAEALLRSATAGVGAALDARLPKFSDQRLLGLRKLLDQPTYFPTGQFTAQGNQLYQIYAGVSIPIFDFGALASNAARRRSARRRST